MSELDWGSYLAAAGDYFCDQIARWRGWSKEFVRWCVGRGFIGADGGDVVFPVHDDEGKFVGVHRRKIGIMGDKGRWRYEPRELRLGPTLYGHPDPNRFGLIVESSWDGLTLLFVLRAHVPPDSDIGPFFIIATRGATNGRRVAEVLPPGNYPLALVMQREPLPEGGGLRPAEKWAADVVAALGAEPGRIWPPEGIKDLNAWAFDGSHHVAIREAIPPACRPCSVQGPSQSPPAVGKEQTVTALPVRRAFPTECLPPVVRDFIRELSRCYGVEEALPGTVVLGVLSAALGRRPRARLVVGYLTSANLYVVVCAGASYGKSTVFEPAAKALRNIEHARLTRWQQETKPVLEARLGVIERTRALDEKHLAAARAKGQTSEARLLLEPGLERLAKEGASIRQQLEAEPRLIAEDVTPERAAVLLAANSEVLSILSAESGDSLAVLRGRYHKKGEAPSDTLLLKAYSLEAHAIDRVGRPSVVLREPCISLLWLMQPWRMRQLADCKENILSGLFPRLLVARVDDEPSELASEHSLDPDNRRRFDALVEDLATEYRLKDGVVEIKCTAGALELMEQFRRERKQAAQAAPEGFDALAARHAEQSCRIAIVLHCAAHGATASQVELSESTVGAAIELTRWFADEQEVMVRTQLELAELEDEQRLRGWFATHPSAPGGGGFTRREVGRHVRGIARDTLLDKLAADGYLVSQVVPRPGPRRVEYKLNPDVAAANAA